VTEGDPGYRGGMSSTRVLILGGDGYLGWPTALHLSARGHEVALVDDFSRRRWHLEQSTDSLTPIRSLDERVDAWEEISGHRLQTHVGDICDADFLDGVVASFRPEAIVHYGDENVPLGVRATRSDSLGLALLPLGVQAQEDFVAEDAAEGRENRFPGAETELDDRLEVFLLESADLDRAFRHVTTVTGR